MSLIDESGLSIKKYKIKLIFSQLNGFPIFLHYEIIHRFLDTFLQAYSCPISIYLEK